MTDLRALAQGDLDEETPHPLSREAFASWLLETPMRMVAVRDVVQRFLLDARAAHRWIREEQMARGWEMVTPVYHPRCFAGTGPDGWGCAGYLDGAISHSVARHREMVCEHCDDPVDMEEARVEAAVMLMPPRENRLNGRAGSGSEVAGAATGTSSPTTETP